MLNKIQFLKSFKSITKYEELKIEEKHYNRLLRYITNQKIGIKNYKLPGYIGSCTEAMISHSIKSFMGYGAKIYKYENFNVILDLSIAKRNGLDPLTVLKEEILWLHDNEAKYYRQNIWRWYKHYKNEKISNYGKKISFPILKSKRTSLQDTIRYFVNN